jgi:hypothetical protein
LPEDEVQERQPEIKVATKGGASNGQEDEGNPEDEGEAQEEAKEE